MGEKSAVVKLLGLLDKGIESKVPVSEVGPTETEKKQPLWFTDAKGRDYLRKKRVSPLLGLLASNGGLQKQEKQQVKQEPEGEFCSMPMAEASSMLAIYGADVVKRMRMCPVHARKTKELIYARDVEGFKK